MIIKQLKTNKMKTEILKPETILEMNDLIANHSTGKFSFAAKVAKTVLDLQSFSDKQALILNEALSACTFSENLELLPLSIEYKDKVEVYLSLSSKRQAGLAW